MRQQIKEEGQIRKWIYSEGNYCRQNPVINSLKIEVLAPAMTRHDNEIKAKLFSKLKLAIYFKSKMAKRIINQGFFYFLFLLLFNFCFTCTQFLCTLVLLWLLNFNQKLMGRNKDVLEALKSREKNLKRVFSSP